MKGLPFPSDNDFSMTADMRFVRNRDEFPSQDEVLRTEVAVDANPSCNQINIAIAVTIPYPFLHFFTRG